MAPKASSAETAASKGTAEDAGALAAVEARLSAAFESKFAELATALGERVRQLEQTGLASSQRSATARESDKGSSFARARKADTDDEADGPPDTEGGAVPASIEGALVGDTAPNIQLDLSDVPWLPVHHFLDSIGEGYTVYPHHSTGGEPALYNLEDEPTRRYIVAAYSKSKTPLHKNETLLDYTVIHCTSFHLACCCAAFEQALSSGAITAEANGRISMPRSDFLLVASAAKNATKVSSILRDRLAHIRAKQSKEFDASTVDILSQALFHQPVSHLGSARFSSLHEQYLAEFDRQLILQGAKRRAHKGEGGGRGRTPKGDDSEDGASAGKDPKKGKGGKGGSQG